MHLSREMPPLSSNPVLIKLRNEAPLVVATTLTKSMWYTSSLRFISFHEKVGWSDQIFLSKIKINKKYSLIVVTIRSITVVVSCIYVKY